MFHVPRRCQPRVCVGTYLRSYCTFFFFCFFGGKCRREMACPLQRSCNTSSMCRNPTAILHRMTQLTAVPQILLEVLGNYSVASFIGWNSTILFFDWLNSAGSFGKLFCCLSLVEIFSFWAGLLDRESINHCWLARSYMIDDWVIMQQNDLWLAHSRLLIGS